MSLKAKLEAVIYAAEEPVTLAQLAVLFAAEALEWKSEQEAATAAAPQRCRKPLQSNRPCLKGSSTRKPGEDPGLNAECSCARAGIRNGRGASAETVSSSDGAPEPAADQRNPPSDAASVDAELEALRLARQRDREVAS